MNTLKIFGWGIVFGLILSVGGCMGLFRIIDFGINKIRTGAQAIVMQQSDYEVVQYSK